MTDKIEYTYCPGEDCTCKVMVWSLPTGELGVNFCCVNCWNFTYATMFNSTYASGADNGTEDTEHWGHSGQCVRRQQARETDPVTELAEYVIMGPQHHRMLREANGEPPVRPV